MSSWLVALLGGALGVLVALLTGRRQGARAERARQTAERARRGLEAERTRRRIEDEIEQDVDLAGRARAAGIVRPDR